MLTTDIYFYKDVEIEVLHWEGFEGSIYNFTLNGNHYQTKTVNQTKILIDYLKS